LSDWFWRGVDILLVGRISIFGVFTRGGTFDIGSNIGSGGGGDIDSTLVWSEGVDDDSSVFVSDFFKRNKQIFSFSLIL